MLKKRFGIIRRGNPDFRTPQKSGYHPVQKSGFLREVAFQLMGSFHVLPAAAREILPWLTLANEVEHLFGSMLGFEAIPARKVIEKRAYCVRSSANRLAGAMLLGGSDSGYWIRWLAVSSASRGRGIGTSLVTTALKAFPPRSSVYVDTFVDDTLDGRAARRLYERSGFTPLSVVSDGDVQRLRYFRETPSDWEEDSGSEANLLSHKSQILHGPLINPVGPVEIEDSS